MKRLISLFILIQVGSKLWVNPETVVAVVGQDKSGYCNDGAEIVITSGTDLGGHSFICSDWDADAVVKQLRYMFDRTK